MSTDNFQRARVCSNNQCGCLVDNWAYHKQVAEKKTIGSFLCRSCLIVKRMYYEEVEQGKKKHKNEEPGAVNNAGNQKAKRRDEKTVNDHHHDIGGES